MHLRFALALALLGSTAHAQNLKQALAELSTEAGGTLSMSCSLPGTALPCDLNPSGKAPMQSVFKLPLALTALHLVEQGKFTLNQPIHFQPSDRIPHAYSPLQDKYPDANVDVPFRELLQMAVSLSDNVAADIVMRVIGGPGIVERYVKSIAITGFQLKDNEAALHHDPSAQYRNWMSPQAAIQLLRRLADHPPLNSNHLALINTWLQETNRAPNRIKGLLPPGTVVLHKPGSSDAVSNDIGLIQMPDGRYLAIAIFLTDSRLDEAARDAIIAKAARAIYDASTKDMPLGKL
jgi:beta-lactamase class A